MLQQQPFYGPLSGTTRVSRYQKKHTHPPSWSSSNLYQLLPSTTIHSILLVQITCLAISCTTSFHVLFVLYTYRMLVNVNNRTVFKWTLETLRKPQDHLYGTMTDGAVVFLVVVHCGSKCTARRSASGGTEQVQCEHRVVLLKQTSHQSSFFNCRRCSRCISDSDAVIIASVIDCVVTVRC